MIFHDFRGAGILAFVGGILLKNACPKLFKVISEVTHRRSGCPEIQNPERFRKGKGEELEGRGAGVTKPEESGFDWMA
jgi:hypothetical protein